MSWVLHDETDKAIIKEIGQQSDRGAIIIAGAFLETRLTQTLELRLDPHATADQLGRMFKGANPLATFSAKIEMGALLQVYPPEVTFLLHKIRELRNAAAHETAALTFDSQSIADRCKNLGAAIGPAFVAATAHGSRFSALVRHAGGSRLTVVDDGGRSRQVASFGFDPTDSPKYMFMTAVKVALYHLQTMKPYLAAVQIVLPKVST